ncbi:hypothetical protein QQ045_009347 [Rhodiola kirilowii]
MGSVEIMNAFKAFKAAVPWSPHLYITLVRGMPGTRKLIHRRIIDSFASPKMQQTVMRWNTPTYCFPNGVESYDMDKLLEIRDEIANYIREYVTTHPAVKRLVAVETEEMYMARKQNLAEHRAVRPPIVIRHSSPTSTLGQL